MQSKLPVSRNVQIALGVVIFHVAGLWALQSGLLRRTVEAIVPVKVISEFIEPPAPQIASPRAAAPAPKTPVKPVAIETLTPQPNPTVTPPANAPTTVSAPVAPLPALVESGSGNKGGKVEPPSSDAQYLQNPAPPYPAMSKRLGEQGTVILHVLIGTDGLAQKAELKQSSGFDRLDQVALKTVKDWRFVPGKRGGVPEAMWFDLPIKFELK